MSEVKINNRWIPWDGGECPVKNYDRVDIGLKDGGIVVNVNAIVYNWGRGGGINPIVAYRLSNANNTAVASSVDDTDVLSSDGSGNTPNEVSASEDNTEAFKVVCTRTYEVTIKGHTFNLNNEEFNALCNALENCDE